MRNAPALLLLTTAMATSAAEPPRAGTASQTPAVTKQQAAKPAPATSCGPSSSGGASTAAYAATGKSSSTACSLDAAATHVQGDPHVDEKGKSAPPAAASGAATSSHAQPGTDVAAAPAAGKDKAPPARR